MNERNLSIIFVPAFGIGAELFTLLLHEQDKLFSGTTIADAHPESINISQHPNKGSTSHPQTPSILHTSPSTSRTEDTDHPKITLAPQNGGSASGTVYPDVPLLFPKRLSSPDIFSKIGFASYTPPLALSQTSIAESFVTAPPSIPIQATIPDKSTEVWNIPEEGEHESEYVGVRNDTKVVVQASPKRSSAIRKRFIITGEEKKTIHDTKIDE